MPGWPLLRMASVGNHSLDPPNSTQKVYSGKASRNPLANRYQSVKGEERDFAAGWFKGEVLLSTSFGRPITTFS